MTTEQEIYVPRPGIVPWRVLTHLLVHPKEELMRKDVAALTGCANASVDAMLQLAVLRGCLIRGRNLKLEMVWRLGSVKTFRLDPLPVHGEEAEPPPAPDPAPPATKAPALATRPPAIIVAPPAAPSTKKPSAAVFRLPASTTFNAEQALEASLQDDLDNVLIAGYDKEGAFTVRSSRMTCAEAAFLAQKMLAWALSGGDSL